MLCGATNQSIDVVRGRLIPGTYLIENFKTLVDMQNLGLAMFNSFRNAIVITVVTLLICSIAGYGFEIYHDKGKDILMSILLLAMMLPFVAIMIPLFKMFTSWKLVNTWIALAPPSISTPFMLMLFRQAARSFPHDIIEAARLEGLSEIQIFFRMFIPVMKSTYGAAMTVTFMNAWNNYLWPTIILQDSKAITMPMLVANLKSGYSVDYGMLMLGVLICTLPTAIIFRSENRAEDHFREDTADIFVSTAQQGTCQKNSTVALVAVTVEQQGKEGTAQTPDNTERPVDDTAAAHPYTGGDTAEDRLCNVA